MPEWPTDLPPDLPRCFARLANMATRAVNRHYNAAMRESGLPITQVSLLAAIRIDRWSTLTALADDLALERTTLLRNLALLERHGLIAPGGTVTAQGKRFHLTEQGRARLDAAIPHWRRAQDAFVNALGTDRAAEIGSGLTHLRRAAMDLSQPDPCPEKQQP